MKKKKYILLTIILFIIGFVVVKSLDVSYSASDYYYYIRRNMLSHHYISNNKSNTASGTILVKTGSRSSETEGDVAIVYCAEQGKNNSSSSHTKKLLSTVSDSLVSSEAKDKLNVIMKYSYPYVTLGELKNYLKDEKIGIDPSVYSSNNFDNLDTQESMTAVQAAIWNAIEATDKFKYGKTVENISSKQSSFNNFGRIDWQTCEGYNTGTNKYATVLTKEEVEWYQTNACSETGNFYKYVYNVKNDGLSDERINALIEWFSLLPSKVTTDENVSNFTVKSHNYINNNDTLTLTVLIDSEGSDYNITFYDYAGNVVLASQDVSGTLEGNTFVIPNLPLTTVGVNAEIVTNTSVKTVYYYQGSEQDWIGVDDPKEPVTINLNILNNGTGQIILYKVKNSSTNVSVDYTKTLPDESMCGQSGCLGSAYFILYASDKKTVVHELITRSESTTISNLPTGTYYLYEQDAPYGYTKYDYNTEFVDEDGFIEINITNGSTASVIVNNDETNVCFTKVDSTTQKVVNGGKFRVEDAEGGTYEIFQTSDQQPKYCISGQLDSGYYYLVEETAPTNYIKSNKIYKFAVGKFNPEDVVVELVESETVLKVESKNGVITIENTPGAVISKSDLSTGACVKGAKLVVRDINGRTLDEWESQCEAGRDTHQIDLDPGKYTLTEEIAPSGYATAETITFTIDKDGKIDKSLDMKDAPIEVCILKTSSNTEEGLIGAELEIYNENGTLYDKFISDVTATCFPYMPVGNYTIKETKAPNGYKIQNEVTKIVVKDTSETQYFEIENEVDVPKTNLDASRTVIIFATIFMVFGLGMVLYYAYKKQN